MARNLRVSLSRGVAAGLAACCLNAGPAMANPVRDDAQILGIYIQITSFDIESAMLGIAQGDAESVRALATHVANDHLAVRQAAYQLAAQCKLTPMLPDDRLDAARNHDRDLSLLLPLRGVAFDKAFLTYEVAFHRAAIDTVKQALLPGTKCPELQTHFKRALPEFEQHFAHTEMLATEMHAIPPKQQPAPDPATSVQEHAHDK